MKKIHNLSMMVKFFLTPVLSVALFLVIGAVLYIAYDSIKRAQDDAERIKQASSQLQEVMLNVANGHANLMRTLIAKQTNFDDEAVRQALEESLADLSLGQVALEQVPALGISAIDASVAELGAQLVDYQASASQTLNMVFVDVSIAGMYLNDSHVSYETFTENWQSLMGDVAAAEFETVAAVEAALSFAAMCFIVALGVAVLLLIGAATLLGGAISRSTLALTTSMTRLADGDKKLEIAGTDRRDELGAMARAVVVFRDGLVRADEMAAESKRDHEVREKRAASISKLTADFDGQVASLIEAVTAATGTLQGTATGLSTASDGARQGATACAAASGEASANVQTVASAAEELAASIQEIGRQVKESTRLASIAVSDSESTNRQVQALAEAASKIGEVVQLITSIAEQTNLLALNATIEAARAGEAGKGFAVVASEVKNLANQTAKATEEIAAQVGEIQEATGSTVASIKGIGERISGMNEIAAQVAAAVEEQNAATHEIARNVQQAAGSSEEVSGNIVSVSQAADETGRAAGEVLSTSAELSGQAETLDTFVRKFLADVRAA